MSHRRMNIRLAGIARESIVDGPGIRFTVFSQGCPHACKGCHNEGTHDFNGGFDCEIDKILNEIDKDGLLDGVTFSGGEPFCQSKAFAVLAEEIHKKPGMNVVTFTGYTYEQLVKLSSEDENIKKLLSETDILIDGPFKLEERDLSLRFRGSRNQRIIEMNETRRCGKIVLADEYMR